MMEKISHFIEKYAIDIDKDIFLIVLFDVFKYKDKEFTKNVQNYQKTKKKVFDSSERKILRKFFYYGKTPLIIQNEYPDFPTVTLTDDDFNIIKKEFLLRVNKYGEDKILSSIVVRIKEIKSKNNEVNKADKWFDFYKKKHSNTIYSSAIIKINKQSYTKINEVGFINFISEFYDKLQNYRHLFLIYEGEIFNENKNITWELIFRNLIELENFKENKEPFFPFKKEKKISQLSEFLLTRFSFEKDYAIKISRDFYSSISYGFKFQDLLIGNDNNIKILVMKKIELDNAQIPCPACQSFEGKSNSYPELFVRSFECSNPDCPERSKSGRGKRFDEYGTLRYFQLVKNSHSNNRIDYNEHFLWRRDIFESGDYLSMIIKFYTWNNENIGFYNIPSDIDLHGRNYLPIDINESKSKIDFHNTKIYELFKELSKHQPNGKESILLRQNLEVINGNSTLEINHLIKDQIGCAITSPPYYNAREYSQWDNLLLYLIDMQLNSNSIFNAMIQSGTYLYNIGDINGNDNIYVDSNMSNRRLPLAAYSYMIFSLLGWEITGNIIWDKGQVQSKRNSTINLFSGYLKPINSYEHVMIFQKEKTIEKLSYIFKLSPVIKINSKGVNIYKHTAPYPLELVELIRPFVKKNKYILDPYLGSGTTLVWCKQNNLKGLGYELNKEYYSLAKVRIDQDIPLQNEISIFE